MNGQSDKSLLIAVLLGGLLAYLVLGDRERPEPGPTPDAGIADVSEAAMRGYSGTLADVFDSLAADLKAGRFSSDVAFGEAMDERSKQVRVDAFKPFREAWAKGQPEAWDAAFDAKLCEEAAKGFRRVAK